MHAREASARPLADAAIFNKFTCSSDGPHKPQKSNTFAPRMQCAVEACGQSSSNIGNALFGSSLSIALSLIACCYPAFVAGLKASSARNCIAMLISGAGMLRQNHGLKALWKAGHALQPLEAF